jgi:hypothetical protein
LKDITNLSLSKLRDYLLSRLAVRLDTRLEAKSQCAVVKDEDRFFSLLIRLGGGGGVMGCIALAKCGEADSILALDLGVHGLELKF